MTDIRDPRQHRYGLGRLISEDPRDAAFPMAAALEDTSDQYPKRDKPWKLGPILNQGETSSCTGHASEAWLMAEPIRTMKGPDAFSIYTEAQKRDPWSAVPHDGSTVRAAMQYLKDAGHIASYVWATDIETISDWLLRRGTIVMGTNWHRSMYRPNDEGIIKVEGPVTGGHAWHLVWFDERRGLFRIQNSWGTDWGVGGLAWLSGEDLEKLVNNNGEACAPTEQRVRRKTREGAAA